MEQGNAFIELLQTLGGFALLMLLGIILGPLFEQK